MPDPRQLDQHEQITNDLYWALVDLAEYNYPLEKLDRFIRVLASRVETSTNPFSMAMIIKRLAIQMKLFAPVGVGPSYLQNIPKDDITLTGMSTDKPVGDI